MTGSSFLAITGIGILTSAVGSMASLVAWFHFDLDDHYKEYKIRRGMKLDERQRDKDIQAYIAHANLLEEEDEHR